MLTNREILIGVTGGIAAYKTAALVSRLRQSGAGVSVIMTESATRLVGPKTFEALSSDLSKDKNDYYYNGGKLNVDIKTFEYTLERSCIKGKD